ncbi:MAG: nucleotidyl transferase AbiEii/AbiGii toxin family protein [Candidatus Omnitrophica bacterium]|nr:nucleotidyl transferase AbiEii/AbiGii toxin family protein [Candidatus Omnitrophota bacterium]
MLHKDKEKFSDMIYRVVKQTGFPAQLLEKDYYLTLILSRINDLSADLIFKGGTCLNKVYYVYYRLSEDLDFSMKLPEYTTTRGNRRKCIQQVKDNIEKFVEQFGLKVDDKENPGRNESKQYVYNLFYQSALRPQEMRIKFEIGLRFNPILETEIREVKHKFLHPFTKEPLFDGGKVNCLSLEEIVSEKLRAAALRLTIAPRDFYDLDFIIRQGFNLTDKKVLNLLVKKIEEDNGDPDLAKYKINLGRSDKEIKDMKSRIENELFDVLTVRERENFDLDTALERINSVMGEVA